MEPPRTTTNTFPPLAASVSGASVDAGGGDPLTESAATRTPAKGKQKIAPPGALPGFFPKSRLDLAIIDAIPGKRSLTCNRIWDELCQIANYKKSNRFELCKLTLANRCGLSDRVMKYACDDLQEAGLLMCHSERQVNGRQGGSVFELFPGVSLYKGGAAYNSKAKRPSSREPSEQKTHGKTPCPMEQKTHGKRQNRTQSMTAHGMPNKEQRFTIVKQAIVKNDCQESEKAACAFAPPSDLTQGKTPTGPAAFFAGVDS